MASYTSKKFLRFNSLSDRIHLKRGLVFGVMIIFALLAFELFNFSTTDFALGDLLGTSSFMGVRWATILALAFCGIDFAGIARLFTPEEGEDEPAEVWYLFGAWLLAATMNAMLTWWGVSIAILDHETLGNAVIDRSVLLKVVPIFVAVMVWLSRVLIIGTFSVAGERLFSQGAQVTPGPRLQYNRQQRMQTPHQPALPRQQTARAPRPQQISYQPTPKPQPRAPRPTPDYDEAPGYSRPEPTYHPISMRSGNTGGRTSSSGYR